ncbi:Gfo/Idh/MocA family oxidoreductase [Actinospica durhamensis]|uniref:Gfo/Idh/MocA family oxidoreductase n=1 Tax=Actinospica durhamensis TaxID=1508375 RepID=A0A941EQU2_9ACTN|nr:Gfo/Idh/MocA family oxidoreductase [Actinospica durhamensis]MBR7835431.1 Gfo/Idh/MocA family oxidoreductase [Actinospica durhamensis]
MSTLQELRVGVVGVGQRAVLAEYANRPGYSRVVSCADTTERGRTDARRLFGPDVAVHEDYRAMTGDDLDAVFVFTPDFLHTEPVVHFLQAGVAVFVEKPMAIGIEDCDAMLAAARTHGARLYVGHNLRHLPALRTMRQLIDEGAVGNVRAVWCRHFVGSGGDYYFKDWHAERDKTTGLLLQKGAHDIDVIHWLAGGYSREVVGLGGLTVYGENPHRRGQDAGFADRRMPEWFDRDAWPPAKLRDLNPIIDVEDLSMMTAKLDNGVYMSYQQCHYTPDYWRNYTVIGDAGRLENFGDGIEGDPAVVRVWNARRSGYRAEADVTVEIRPDTAERHGGADQQLVAEFLRFAVEGGPTETSPLAAREAVAAGVAATESLRAGGRPVAVPELDPALAAYFQAHQRTDVPV